MYFCRYLVIKSILFLFTNNKIWNHKISKINSDIFISNVKRCIIENHIKILMNRSRLLTNIDSV